jgi:hypothetical protein
MMAELVLDRETHVYRVGTREIPSVMPNNTPHADARRERRALQRTVGARR